MREKYDPVRELGRGAFGEASNVAEACRSWALYFGVAAAAGTFLAFTGAFGTDDIPIGGRLIYWVSSILIGSVFGQGVRVVVVQFRSLGESPWLTGIVMTIAISVPGTVLIWLINKAMLPDVELHIVSLFGMVMAISGAMTSLFMLVGQARARRTEAGAAPPRFLERLPGKLRGGALFAVQAEDHYLRLHTDRGQDLILLRLSDAIGELDGIEGMQVHRSWWVARDGVAEVKRTDGKVFLSLKNGVEAPVSRANLRALKEQGWL